MAPVALAGFLSALSSAGMPPFVGFVGKDLIYEATLHHDWKVLLTSLALFSNICLVVAGFFAGIRPFIGNLSFPREKMHLPDIWLMVPPALLAMGSLVFGLFPSFIDSFLVQPMVSSIGSEAGPVLKLWHGFNLVLGLSALTLVLGGLLYWKIKPGPAWEGLLKPFDALAPVRWFEAAYRIFYRLAYRLTCLLLHGYLRHYVYLMVAFLLVLLFWKITELPDPIDLDFQQITELTFYEGMIIVVMLFAMLLAVFSKNRLGSIASMSVVGFSICLLFLFFSAPDLAMTQFAIETLTLVMFLLIIFRLPKYLVYSAPLQRAKDAVLALSLGTAVFLIAMAVLNQDSAKEITAFYAENAYKLAKGKNVVNVILVDFRGIDTMIEIVVLSIAAVGVFSLLKLNKESKEDLEA
jgi:multicomponent Na+:H+ antiporter subunit A